MTTQTLHKSAFSSLLLDAIKNQRQEIQQWLTALEASKDLPLYSSMDMRDAGFKIAVVDTNLFPAGFNNLCEHGIEDSVKFMRKAVLKRVPGCKNVLIVAEEHTRNTWYLENVRVLQDIIQQAGFQAKIATFLNIQPAFCEGASFVQLETATHQPVQIHCFQKTLNDIKIGQQSFDLIILNNDLTGGIPDILKEARIPIYPSLQAGWHSRLKSHHFKFTGEIIREFSQIIGVDPWLLSALFAVADPININDASDQQKLQDMASDLFQDIRKKYAQHHIEEKPFIFIKSDSGTYGMAVMAIEDPSDFIHLNRKDKNKLYKGKGSQVINRYLLQEGVPTIYQIEREVSEVCIYQIENNLVGGFYRSHAQKSDRENLNTQGMDFKKMCPHSKKYGDCGIQHDMNIFDIYRILARIAGIAASREIDQLENNPK